MPRGNRPAAAEIVVLSGGVVTAIGSVMDVLLGSSAWGRIFFPVMSLVPAYALFVAGPVAMRHFGNWSFPDHAGFGISWRRLNVALSALAFVMAVLWMLTIDGEERGLQLMVVGTAACLVGAVLDARNTRTLTAVRSSPAVLGRTGSLLIGGAMALLVGSFLDFRTYFDPGQLREIGFNAWSRDTLFTFPIAIFPVACAALVGLHYLLTTFARVPLGATIAGFTWAQIYIVLGFQAAVLMVAFLVQDRLGTDYAIGFWLMLGGAIAVAVGAVFNYREVGPSY